MKRFALLLVVLCGCAPGVADQQPAVAVFGAYGVMATPQPTPAVCPTCNGLKQVGDGRVMVPCPTCCPKPDGKPVQEAKSCLSGTCVIRR